MTGYEEYCETPPESQRRIRAQGRDQQRQVSEFRDQDIQRSIPDRFEQQVEHHPHRVAVSDSRRRLTYLELNDAANRAALAVLDRKGTREDRVALLLESGAASIVALLGILKAGKVCVPIDTSFPRSRILHMIEDADATLVVTNRQNLELANGLAGKGKEREVLDLDDLDPGGSPRNPGLPLSPDRLAYIVYTSGSTGKAKGVIHTHRTILHIARNYTNSFGICPQDRLTLLHSLGFVSGLHDVSCALLNGAALHSFDPRGNGLDRLAQWLVAEEITLLNWFPTAFRSLVTSLSSGDRFPHLRLAVMGSEPFLASDGQRYQIHPSLDCTFVNRLGTTEAGPFCLYFFDSDTEIAGATVPVGSPMQDKAVRLLDGAGREVGPGQIGEIAVRSGYLSPGYWRQPDLTRTVFLPDPDGGHETTYLTGDLGRMCQDGCLVHIGRKDSQVKIRGHRVEVSAIENELLGRAIMLEAAVTVRDDRPGVPRLVAYCATLPGHTATSGELRASLLETLPAFMVPSAFVMLDRLPRTPTGKLDRGRLPDPEPGEPGAYVAPRTPTEEAVAEIWAETLGVDRVGVYDDFFELGGDSLRAIQIISRMKELCSVEVSLRSLFEAPTVAALADRKETTLKKSSPD